MPDRRFTPREAAAISGASFAAIQKAITTGQLPVEASAGERRVLGELPVLALALSKRLSKTLALNPDAALALLRSAPQLDGQLTVGAIRIDLKETLEEPRRRITLLDRARKLVDSRGRVTGTGIEAELIGRRLADGATPEALGQELRLETEAIEAVGLWATANPPRGRPRQSRALAVPPPRDLSAWTRTMQISASQVDAWAQTREAQAVLPNLVRRLALACGQVSAIDMPAGESTSRPGWDGVLVCDQANPWTPRGRSFWEMSCEARSASKALDDFVKRTEQTPSEVRADSAFVFVTARRWPQKGRWLKTLEDGGWREIRAYDADDLEQWLERAPAVALWFADTLGLTGHGVESLSRFWQTWAQQCSPTITPAALAVGRASAGEDLVKRVRDRLSKNQQDPLTLKADSVSEASAFAAAVMLGQPDLSSSAIVVTDEAGWRFVEKNLLVKIAISAAPELAESPARRAGLVVVIPFAAGDMTEQYRGAAGREAAELVLERPGIREFEDALKEIGVEGGDAKRLAVSTGRSWSVFRRRMATNPAIREPAWLHRQQVQALSTVCLLGSWSSSYPGDLDAVAEIAGRSAEDVERDLRKLASVDDAPVLSIGAVWKAKAPLELLDLFGEHITRSELDRFFGVARALLTMPAPEIDVPPERRFFYFERERKHSGLLLKAVCDTLIKLAVRGVSSPQLGNQLGYRIESFVSELLEGADDRRWLSLASHLPSLAEAAPEAFLHAIETSLRQPGAPVTQLITETGDSGLMGRCWHSGLLWALEMLAWAPERLTRVALILARLSPIPIKGNWANTPLNSLISLFKTWFPQTAANIDQRIAAVDRVTRAEPEVGYQLLDGLVGDGRFGIAFPTHRPTWRDDDAGAGNGASGKERHAMLLAAGDRQIEMAEGRPDWIAKLIAKIGIFDQPRVERILEMAEAVALTDEAGDAREALRQALREQISRGDYLRRKERDDGFDVVKALETTYQTLEPEDLVSRYRWLFISRWPDLPIARPDVHDRLRRVVALREEALKAINKAEGLDGLARLARCSAGEDLVGWVLPSLGLDANSLAQWVCELAGDLSAEDPITSTVGGLLRASKNEGAEAVLRRAIMLGRARGWDDNQVARLLALARDERTTWDLALWLGPTVENAYWGLCQPHLWLRDDSPDFEYALRRLLSARRARTALRAIHGEMKGLPADLVAQILEQILEGDELSGWPLESWSVGEAIDHLEKSKAIDEARMIRLEFGLLPALGHEGEYRARTLYRAIMSEPQLFVELLTIVYRPEQGEVSETTDGMRQAAETAWRLLHHCRRQPGQTDEGTVDAEAFVRFVEKSRELAQAAYRLGVCDSNLGQILAHAPPDPDGVWPCEPVRDLLDRPELEDMRSGFQTGLFNKRGVTSRAYDEGGGLERTLAKQYRDYASAIESTHVQVAASLVNMARWYENDAAREDTHARLRIEGY